MQTLLYERLLLLQKPFDLGASAGHLLCVQYHKVVCSPVSSRPYAAQVLTTAHVLCTQFSWTPGQPLKHLHSSSATQAPGVLAQWIVKQGGAVEGVAVQPAGDGTGYSLWSHVVKTATPATRDIAFAIMFTLGDQPSGC